MLMIRRAQPQDIPAMGAIYNYEVVHGTATFDLHEKPPADREAWYAAHNRDNHPLLVAEEDGRVTGYASLSPYRDKEAYASTVELSVYVHPDCRRRGIARALMAELLALARADARTHTVIAVITGGNEASIRLHEAFGFRHSGTLHAVGRKFGRYLDVENYELSVGD